MYALVTEELVRALVREREEEARRARPHVSLPREPKDSLRARVARLLVRAAVHLDGSAGTRSARCGHRQLPLGGR